MRNGAATTELTMGFLSIQRDESAGYLGGHLVLNGRGRPLEFRCTAPVQPSRAQQVLYGATLSPYLRGEVIARALFQNTRIQPDLIFTDDADNLEVRQHIDTPLLWVVPPSSAQPADGICQATHDPQWRLVEAPW